MSLHVFSSPPFGQRLSPEGLYMYFCVGGFGSVKNFPFSTIFIREKFAHNPRVDIEREIEIRTVINIKNSIP